MPVLLAVIFPYIKNTRTHTQKATKKPYADGEQKKIVHLSVRRRNPYRYLAIIRSTFARPEPVFNRHGVSCLDVRHVFFSLEIRRSIKRSMHDVHEFLSKIKFQWYGLKQLFFLNYVLFTKFSFPSLELLKYTECNLLHNVNKLI